MFPRMNSAIVHHQLRLHVHLGGILATVVRKYHGLSIVVVSTILDRVHLKSQGLRLLD